MTSLVLWDLDSTVADTSHRHTKTPDHIEGYTWVDYSMHCDEDVPFEGARRLIQLLRLIPSLSQVYLSARSMSAFDKTLEWLLSYDLKTNGLLLRPDDNTQTPLEWKKSEIRAIQADGHEIELLVDDNIGVTAMAEELGIPTLTVNMYRDLYKDGLHL